MILVVVTPVSTASSNGGPMLPCFPAEMPAGDGGEGTPEGTPLTWRRGSRQPSCEELVGEFK